MDLITFFKTTQNAHGVLYRWFPHIHLLEPTLKGRVFLNVFAVLVQGGGTDHAQLTTSEHGLDHVAGVHGTFGGTGTYDGVEFVHKGDDLTGSIGDLF